jgi:cytochrome c oxidase cbb3-type subunit III
MKNKIFTLVLAMCLPLMVMAQDVTPSKTFWDDPINHPMAPFYALLALVGIVIVLILVVAVVLFQVLNTILEKAAKEKAEHLGIVYVPEPSWWQKVDRKLTNAVPLEKEATIVLDHNYDGIKELDNHLPPWWKWLFLGTIGWAAVYLIVYHIAETAPSQEQEYENEVMLAEAQVRKTKALQPLATINEDSLVFTNDAAMISNGKTIYISNCASCHKNLGEGSIGPNLTDAYWLHGGGIKNIFLTIKNGVPEKGMISWTGILKPEEMRDVSFFIMSIGGSNPPNAKAPQGVIWKEEIKIDSVRVDSTTVTTAGL